MQVLAKIKIKKFTLPSFLDASVPLAQAAKKIAVQAQINIRQRRRPDFSTQIKLKKSTIDKKRRAGMPRPTTPLFGTGQMHGGIRPKKLGKNHYGIGVRNVGHPSRTDVAQYHHNEGVGPQKTKRPFIGLNPKLITWINARFERWFVQQGKKRN